MSGLLCLTQQTLMVNHVQPIFLHHENVEFGLRITFKKQLSD